MCNILEYGSSCRSKVGNEHSLICRLCKEDICQGDEYYIISSGCYHNSCLLENYTKEELLALTGNKLFKATENQFFLECILMGKKTIGEANE